MEAVAVLMSKGVKKTNAFGLVSDEMKIPYGNFARWMAQAKKIED